MRARAEVVVFGLAVAAGWTLAAISGWSNPRPAGAEAAQGGQAREGSGFTGGVAPTGAAARAPALFGPVAPDAAQSALRAGAAAQARGELAEADRQFRKAWRLPEARRAAAEALRALHGHPQFKLPVDEGALAETRKLLPAGFARYETAHFVMLSDAGRDWTMNKGALLERAHHQFFRVMDRMEYPAAPPESKLRCVFFRDHAGYASFAREHDGVEAPWVAGYYAGLSNRVVFYDDRTGPSFVAAFDQLEQFEREASEMRTEARRAGRTRGEDVNEARAVMLRAEEMTKQAAQERERLSNEAAAASEAKTIHEAVHLLAFNCGVQSRSHQYPFWLTEGLAASFETDRPHAAFGPDFLTGGRQKEYEAHRAAGRLFELETLVALDRPPDREPETADVMYSQSYALVSYLYRNERRGLAEFLMDIAAEPPGSIDPQRRVELFEARFGEIDRVERVWLARAR